MRNSHISNKRKKEGDSISIKSKRAEKGWTQRELAEKLKVDQTAVHRWEEHKNGIRQQYLIEMSKLFECSIDELLREDE